MSIFLVSEENTLIFLSGFPTGCPGSTRPSPTQKVYVCVPFSLPRGSGSVVIPQKRFQHLFCSLFLFGSSAILFRNRGTQMQAIQSLGLGVLSKVLDKGLQPAFILLRTFPNPAVNAQMMRQIPFRAARRSTKSIP